MINSIDSCRILTVSSHCAGNWEYCTKQDISIVQRYFNVILNLKIKQTLWLRRNQNNKKKSCLFSKKLPPNLKGNLWVVSPPPGSPPVKLSNFSFTGWLALLFSWLLSYCYIFATIWLSILLNLRPCCVSSLLSGLSNCFLTHSIENHL